VDERFENEVRKVMAEHGAETVYEPEKRPL
jgi:hypothetical protein